MPPIPMLPVIQLRPVDPKWTCCRSGDCCTKIAEVVMTVEEQRRLVLVAPREITMAFRPFGEGFVAMQAGPCPLYVFGGCLVYEHRPYNCRRYVCLRPDVKTEPFETNGANLTDRVATSRVARRLAVKVQRKAQKWARKMGWEPPPS